MKSQQIINVMGYLEYNREERDLCAHLFRLLLEDQPHWGPLRRFLGMEAISTPRIYCEVALIRDTYHVRKSKAQDFLSQLCKQIAVQEEVDADDYIKFADLPDKIRDPKITHPKQIKYKLEEAGKLISEADRKVYGSLQGMFNAKPDLAICSGNKLFIYEAKYTSSFDEAQMRRTMNIGQIWAEMLYTDLGFDEPPEVVVYKLGLKCFNPNVSWEQVYEIAHDHWGRDDFSTRVFSKVLR